MFSNCVCTGVKTYYANASAYACMARSVSTNLRLWSVCVCAGMYACIDVHVVTYLFIYLLNASIRLSHAYVYLDATRYGIMMTHPLMHSFIHCASACCLCVPMCAFPVPIPIPCCSATGFRRAGSAATLSSARYRDVAALVILNQRKTVKPTEKYVFAFLHFLSLPMGRCVPGQCLKDEFPSVAEKLYPEQRGLPPILANFAGQPMRRALPRPIHVNPLQSESFRNQHVPEHSHCLNVSQRISASRAPS